MRGRHVQILAAVFLLASCRTPRTVGTLPPPPADEALANDGSEAQQALLEKRYAVRMDDLEVFVGDAIRPRWGREYLVFIMLNQDVTAYISSDGNAVVQLPSPAWNYVRMGLSLAALLSIPLMLAFLLPGLVLFMTFMVLRETGVKYIMAKGQERAVETFNTDLRYRIKAARAAQPAGVPMPEPAR